MRFFLHSYRNSDNFKISKSKNIFGCPDTKDGLPTKFKNLKNGDIVIIRDSSTESLKVLGCCIVKGTPNDIRHKIQSFSDLLWSDEIKEGKIIYPYRVDVNFDIQLDNNLFQICWDDLLNLNLKNKKGKPYNRKGIPALFRGNFIEEGEQFSQQEIEKFINLIGAKNWSCNEGIDIQISKSNFSISLAQELEEDVFPEGRIFYRKHRQRERSKQLVEKAKARRKEQVSVLICDVCEFNFSARYGKVGTDYIECHHTKPISELKENEGTKLEDIALVCANCHRMLHRKRPWLSIEQLKSLLK
jgi:ssDNA-binding Zn-finger/Zn-ribbon topoisomerase 1